MFGKIENANLFIYNGISSWMIPTNDLYIEILGKDNDTSIGRYAIDGEDYIERNVVIYNVRECKVVPFSKQHLEYLCGYLFKEGYKFLNIEDRNFYGMFIKKHTIWYRGADKGKIELIFRLKPYKYSNIKRHIFNINNNTYKNTIEVKGDAEHQFCPEEILIENKSRDFLNISIENKSIPNNKLTFTTLIPIDRIFIDGKEDYMISKVDVSEDLYKKSNKNYLKLNEGINTIEVIGNRRVEVIINFRDRYTLKEGDLFWVKE